MNKERVDLLESTLKQVIDWLKFAEAKNGALVALGCATIFGVLRLSLSIPIESESVNHFV